MEGLKNISELEVLRLAASALNAKLKAILDKAEKDFAGGYCSYDVQIEAIDEQLQEIYEAMEAIEKEEVRA